MLGALDQLASAINFNDTRADPFQPDVLIRGFEASPVLGTPQGMAVYQNGVPINEAADPDVDAGFLSPAMPRAYFGGVKISF